MAKRSKPKRSNDWQTETPDERRHSPRALTAGLHSLTMAGATVQWNEKINGHQVDVTVRFTIGQYQFLTIIECRDRSRRSTRDDVVLLENRREATGANKAVFVSARGFQSGACEYAESKGIDLFTLKEMPADWPAVVTAALPAHLAIKSITVVRVDGTLFTPPDDQAARCLSLGRLRSQKGRVLTVNQAYQAFVPDDWRARVGDFGIHAGLKGEPWLLTVHGLPDIRVKDSSFASKPSRIRGRSSPDDHRNSARRRSTRTRLPLGSTRRLFDRHQQLRGKRTCRLKTDVSCRSSMIAILWRRR